MRACIYRVQSRLKTENCVILVFCLELKFGEQYEKNGCSPAQKHHCLSGNIDFKSISKKRV